MSQATEECSCNSGKNYIILLSYSELIQVTAEFKKNQTDNSPMMSPCYAA